MFCRGVDVVVALDVLKFIILFIIILIVVIAVVVDVVLFFLGSIPLVNAA